MSEAVKPAMEEGDLGPTASSQRRLLRARCAAGFAGRQSAARCSRHTVLVAARAGRAHLQAPTPVPTPSPGPASAGAPITGRYISKYFQKCRTGRTRQPRAPRPDRRPGSRENCLKMRQFEQRRRTLGLTRLRPQSCAHLVHSRCGDAWANVALLPGPGRWTRCALLSSARPGGAALLTVRAPGYPERRCRREMSAPGSRPAVPP